ncbi:MAG: UDP-N-acetylmuramate--L-alanine ligase [Clostridia bacterium]|nr:UDP-N-acetylmuramate--L-alanine ligase [Clostridia bacterium]
MEHKVLMDMIKNKKPIFLSGIGGVSMRALARLLYGMGACVSGSDRDESETLDALRETGIKVYTPQKAENVYNAALVIRTAAVPDSNPEILYARENGVPVMERAEAWGLLMLDYKKAICVAGTHGKTTTTAMIATLGVEAGLDPTVMVGGDFHLIHGSLRDGSKRLIVAEACEYKNSFLSFNPTIAVILNVEYDHPDFFKDINAVVDSFKQFALRTDKSGTVIYCADDENAVKAISSVDRKLMSFGVTEGCDVRADNIKLSEKPSFDIYYGGKKWAEVTLTVPGAHNVKNALAAACCAILLGIDGESFSRYISCYGGVGRRMEYVKSFSGADIYDDYAHHPSEIEATLTTARTVSRGRVLCVFQPHTFTRTAALLDGFAKALSIADKVCVCPIFAARETDDLAMSEQVLADRIPNAEAAPSITAAARWIENNAREGDLILTMGAGDVFKAASQIRSEKMRVISVTEEPEYKTAAIRYFDKVWGTNENRKAFENSISYSAMTSSPFPRFYLLEEGDDIIGCAALYANDYISRQDLMPWICSVYIEPSKRGNGFGGILLDRAREDARAAGYKKVYIATGHIGYYEHFGFKHIGAGFRPWGESERIYEGKA